MLSSIMHWSRTAYVRTLSRLYGDEKGQTMAEYGLILAVIAVIAVGAFILLGQIIDSRVSSIAGAFDASA